jgi:gluconolactonase
MPASDYLKLDDRFSGLIHANAGPELVWTGGRWTEGPAYLPAGRYAVWSDIPNDRVMRWDEASGHVSVFEAPCRYQNGHTVDREGRLVACEHQGRCVCRIEHDGSRRVLADAFEGRRLNSPNDVVMRSDGSVWFSDPTYGIDSDYEGDAAVSEIGASHVYRIAPDGTVNAVVTDMLRPNGLAFSPDERLLYVADTGVSHDPACTPRIRVYPVEGDAVGEGRDFAACDAGVFDGFRVDTAGNLWTSAADGVHVLAADGTLLGKVRLPEVVSNLCFAGPKRNRLIVTATTSVYAIYVNARGAAA